MNAITVLMLTLTSADAFAQTHLLLGHDSKALFLALDKTNGKIDGHFGTDELSDVFKISVPDADLLRNAMDLNEDGVIDEHEAVELMHDAAVDGKSAGVNLGNAYGVTIAFVEGTPSGGEIDLTIDWDPDYIWHVWHMSHG